MTSQSVLIIQAANEVFNNDIAFLMFVALFRKKKRT